MIPDKKFLSGDIGLTMSDSWISKLIVWFTSGQTGDASKSHGLLSAGQELIVEPLASGKICINKISKYDNSNIDFWRIPLNDEDRENLKLGILQAVNSAYGFLKLPLFALDSVATKILSLFGRKEPVFFFTKYFGISSFKVCTQFVVWAIHKFTSYRFRDKNDIVVDWKIVSPDYLEDLLKLPINQASLIYSQQAPS